MNEGQVLPRGMYQGFEISWFLSVVDFVQAHLSISCTIGFCALVVVFISRKEEYCNQICMCILVAHLHVRESCPFWFFTYTYGAYYRDSYQKIILRFICKMNVCFMLC